MTAVSKRFLRSAGVGLLAVLTACASDRGIPAFRVYDGGFAMTETVLDGVVDELEAAERKRAVAAIRAGRSPLEPDRDAATRIAANGGFDDAFHIADAPYFAATGVPPATAGFRRAIDAVAAFNAVARGYADGGAAAAIESDVVDLGRALGGLAPVVGAGTAPLALPIGAPVAAAAAVLEAALAEGTRAAFRDAVVRTHPAIDAILVGMRDAAPEIFGILTADARAAAKDANAAGQAAARGAAIAEIEKYRIVMSNWVVALDGSRRALARVVAAIGAPAGPGSPAATLSVADLAASTAEAAAIADRTRTLLGEIRTAR